MMNTANTGTWTPPTPEELAQIKAAFTDRKPGRSVSSVIHSIQHPDLRPRPQPNIRVYEHVETAEKVAENVAAALATKAWYLAERIQRLSMEWSRGCPPGTVNAHVEAQVDPQLRSQLLALLVDFKEGKLKNAYLQGATGTGKSYAAAGLCRAAIEVGQSFAWATMSSLADLSKPNADPDARRRLFRADLLVIDDWGAARHTREVVELVKQLQDQRLTKTVIWTSNKPLPDDAAVWDEVAGLPKYYSEAEKVELSELLERVYDRVRKSLRTVTFTGQSLRRDEAARTAIEQAEKSWWDTHRPGQYKNPRASL